MKPVDMLTPQMRELMRPDRPGAAAPDGRDTESPTVSFGDTLREALDRVGDEMKAADDISARYIAGEEVDLHSVVISVQKAELSFRTMLEVRNKLLDAYREIMQMQV